MSRGNINKMVIAAACIINILVGYLTRNNYMSTVFGGIIMLAVMVSLAGYFIRVYLKLRREKM